MAERRMFTTQVVDSDEFLELPLTAQALYFHLGMRADDDGFVHKPKAVLRTVLAGGEDLDRLVERGFVLLLDGIQDPGNLGTILRTADALDVPVVLMEGCADPYSHKVVRASMGAVFRRDTVQAGWKEVYAACQKRGIPIGVTALSDRAEDLRRAPLHTMAVVIGSEGQGVRPEILDSADRELIIPMNSHCESLNAAIAAAIVMWQIKGSGD